MSRSFFANAMIAFGAAALIAGPALAQSTNTKQNPPVKMGTSGGSVSDSSRSFCCGGTLGALVTRNGQLHILSNNHVVARSGSAVAGEDIAQPALIDSACRSTSSNIVGDFAGNLVPLGTGNIDAGLAVARANMVDTTGAILNIGVPCSNIQLPTVGLPVRKSGRTTGHTTGTIQALNVNVSITYQAGCNSGKRFSATFLNQISITPGNFSAGGDSGSLIVSNDGTPNPVGLLFAGSSSITIANPISDVIAAFASGGNTFSFVGQSCATAASSAVLSGVAQAEVDHVREVKERHEPALFARAGVLGVGVGKVNDNPETSEAAIVVYVQSRDGSLPKGFPKELDGVAVRVIPTDEFVAR